MQWMQKIIVFIFCVFKVLQCTSLEVIKLEFILKLKINAMTGCLQTRVSKQQIIVLYFEFETVFKFYYLEAWS